jgi:hypothetical protein
VIGGHGGQALLHVAVVRLQVNLGPGLKRAVTMPTLSPPHPGQKPEAVPGSPKLRLKS